MSFGHLDRVKCWLRLMTDIVMFLTHAMEPGRSCFDGNSCCDCRPNCRPNVTIYDALHDGMYTVQMVFMPVAM